MPFTEFLDSTREYAASSPLFSAAIGIAVLLVLISLARQEQSNTQTASDGKTRIPITPLSWIPFIGHMPELAVGGDGYLLKLSKRIPEGIWTLRLFGRNRYYVTDPALQASLYDKPKSDIDGDAFKHALMKSNFGFSDNDIKNQDSFAQDALDQFLHLTEEPGLGKATHQMIDDIKRSIGDFITFNSYPADQAEWENVSGVQVVSGSNDEEYVEANLLDLVRNFMGPTAMGAIFGLDFVTNFPDIYQLLWEFDKGFSALKQESRWFPSAAAQRAKAARAKILVYLREYETAFEKYLDGQGPGARWQDLDQVGGLVRGRVELWRKHGLSIDARAARDLALLWATAANANPATAWMIYEICRDPVILGDVQREVSQYLKVNQPENHFGPAVWIAPEVESIDFDGLVSKCKTLRAAYLETLRLYTAPCSVMKTKKDLLAQAQSKDGDVSFLIKKNHEVHLLLEPHQLDHECFPDPMDFQPSRHIENEAADTSSEDWEQTLLSIRRYAGNEEVGRLQAFAMREMMVFTAFILSMYDIRPPEGQQWTIPTTRKHAIVKLPARPLTVWIKRKTF